jgi:hypothetical protein
MKSLRFAFLALAVLGAVALVSASHGGNVSVASDGGSPLPPHGGGR